MTQANIQTTETKSDPEDKKSSSSVMFISLSIVAALVVFVVIAISSNQSGNSAPNSSGISYTIDCPSGIVSVTNNGDASKYIDMRIEWSNSSGPKPMVGTVQDTIQPGQHFNYHTGAGNGGMDCRITSKNF